MGKRLRLNYKIIFYFFGLLLVFNGGFILLSALVSLIYQDGVTLQLVSSGLGILIFGLLGMINHRNHKPQEQFLILQTLFLKPCLVLQPQEHPF